MRWLDCLNWWANIGSLQIVSEISYSMCCCCSCVLTTKRLEWTRVGRQAETTWLMAITITITINAVNNVFFFLRLTVVTSSIMWPSIVFRVTAVTYRSYKTCANTNTHAHTYGNDDDMLKSTWFPSTPLQRSHFSQTQIVRSISLTHPFAALSFPFKQMNLLSDLFVLYLFIIINFAIVFRCFVFFRSRSFICSTFSFHAYQESKHNVSHAENASDSTIEFNNEWVKEKGKSMVKQNRKVSNNNNSNKKMKSN